MKNTFCINKEEVNEVMSRFGYTNGRVTTTGDRFQVGYWDYPTQNKRGERLVVEVNCSYNEETPHSLPVIWYKNGFTDRLILNYFSVNSYVYDKDGNCFGKYDFTKTSEDVRRRVIDFDWILEANVENLEKMISEMTRRFNG